MMSASVSADDRLTVSGFIDSRFTTTDNLSLFDGNYTKAVLGGDSNATGQAGDADAMSSVVTRFNLKFTIEAFENSMAVMQTHVDKEWGQEGTLFGRFQPFDDYTHTAGNGAYGGAMSIEGFWFESLIPGTAATFQVGVPYFAAESGSFGEATKVFNIAAPGVTLSAPFSDTISTYTWYAWLGQDFDGFFTGFNKDASDTKITGNGNDWAAGTRIGFTLMEGLSVDLLYAYQLNECGVVETCNTDENRNWLGGTMRYQYGDFSLLPSLVLYFADDNDPMAKGDGSTQSLLLDVRAKYTAGPLTLGARLVYTPGDSADQDRSYDVIGVWGVPGSVEGFGLFGNAYGRTDLGPITLGTGSAIQVNMRHDTYGLVHAAAMADYTLTPQTTLSVALGLFNSAEDVEGGTPAGVTLGEGESVTYAGGTHVATELDAWLTYQLYSNAKVILWAAYAITGDALDLMMAGMAYESQDVLGAGATVAYNF